MKKIQTLITFIILTLLFLYPVFIKAQDNNASSSDEIRKKVQEKIIKISQKPKAFIGTITDISESTIQISRFAINKESQEKSGEILQISYNKDTAIIDSREKAKQIKAQDLAIGDFIIAMGTEKNGNILESSRIVSVKPITPTKRASFKLNVKKVGKQEISAELKNGQSYSVKINKDTSILDQENNDLKVSDIEAGDKIIATGETQEQTISARTIFVLKE